MYINSHYTIPGLVQIIPIATGIDRNHKTAQTTGKRKFFSRYYIFVIEWVKINIST
jgi:hypothetical protein